MPRKRNIEEEKDPEGVDWSGYLVNQLKDELGRRGLPKTGRKSDLVARLQASDDGASVVAPEAPAIENPPAEAGPSNSDAPSKKKRAKKEKSPDVIIEGQLASEVIIYQNVDTRTGERRQKPFVAEPDAKFKDRVKRIRKERMFMLNRQKAKDARGRPCEVFDIAGSTGNIYRTEIGRSPSCTCMDARIRGNKCKHISYALIIIYKAPMHFCYQQAFLSHELESIWANAPVTRAPDGHNHDAGEEDESKYNGKRKPIDGECPICVFDMSPDEEIVWCKAACGQNFHKECFDQWKVSKRGGMVTCVYCRSPWQEDDAPIRPAPGSLATLKDIALKVGSYKNIGHMAMYSQAATED
ncbi:hypothetical protein DSL72_007178 [Monilinia vaccinii-corymbosi]|uniref:Postreplication repair E3 ubiquitin-protein ligase RAD18 n=1 Tax=Monilinia vaccinii-corymbosi TaxID=61207 RepID=A0A8A3PM92_9HELO|nr:hypothetical protein DSL72_007178 [Monilinia vaccinii-corymbosi]